jgi:polysaccharide biosynthesis/export protein VpsN
MSRIGLLLRSRSVFTTVSFWCLLLATVQVGVAQQRMAGGPDGSGIVRIGDQIAVRIWREEDLSGEFVVDHNGDVVLPRLGIVRVSGRPADELQQWLRAEFEQFVRHPSIEVRLLRRVGVHGEVRNPDLYMVDLTMTLRDVIAKAGGLTEQAAPDRITIVRGGERIRLGRGTEAQFLTADLQSGDQVVVGRRNWIALNPFAVISTATTLASLLLVAFR